MSTLRTKGFSLPLSAGSLPCRVSHSRCPLIKLQPCSLLSCWQTKVLKRTPSVIASNLRHNVVFHVNCSDRKGSCCSLCLFFHRLCSPTFTMRSTLSKCFFALLCFQLWGGHSVNICSKLLGSFKTYTAATSTDEHVLGTMIRINIMKFRENVHGSAVVLGELLHLWPEFSPCWASGSLQLEVFLWFGQVSLCPAWDKASAGPGTGVWEQAGGAEQAGCPPWSKMSRRPTWLVVSCNWYNTIAALEGEKEKIKMCVSMWGRDRKT